MAEIEHVLEEIGSFVRLAGAREDGATISVAEATLLKLDLYIHFLCSLTDVLRGRSRFL